MSQVPGFGHVTYCSYSTLFHLTSLIELTAYIISQTREYCCGTLAAPCSEKVGHESSETVSEKVGPQRMQ